MTQGTVNFSFGLVRAILLDEPAAQNADFRAHVLWMEKNGLIGPEGLTTKGKEHGRLVADFFVFEAACKRARSAFGVSASWHQLIAVLKHRERIKAKE